VARRTLRLDELVVEEKPLPEIPPEKAAAALEEGLRSLGAAALPWDDDSRDFAARAEFVRALNRSDLSDWPDFSEAALLVDLSWLAAFLTGVTRRSHLSRIALTEALRSRLTHAQQRKLDELAPTHVALPTGTRTKIDYRDDNAPCASMRMQEVFGLATTPK